jgi:hypothetical protein
MATNIATNQNTFFPDLVPGLQNKTTLTYLNSNYPSVLVEEVVIANDIKTVGEGVGEETVTVTVSSKISEAILQTLVDDDEFRRFYDTPSYIKNLRIRMIACFGNQGIDLDFITQRMNEYQAGLMSISGEENADQFYVSLVNSLSTRNYALVSPSGPFGSDFILNTLKTNLEDKIYYDATTVNDGIILCDIPVDDALLKDKNGKVIRDKKTKPVRKNNSAEGADNFQNYVLDNIVLKPFIFKMGKNEVYTNTNLSNIRFYAFTYMDNQAFLEDKNISRDYTIGEEDRLLETGMGFVKRAVFRGVEHNFIQQERTTSVTRDEIESEISTPPLAAKLSDQRGYGRLSLVDFKKQMNLTTTELLKDIDLNNKIYEEIGSENFFSDFWVTRCEDDSARFGFVFDKLAFLVKNSELPFLYTNPSTATDLLIGGGDLEIEDSDTVKCLDITLSKRQIRVEPTVGVNRLTFGRQKKFDESYYHPEEIIPEPVLIPNLGSFLNPAISKRMSFYEGYDTYEDEFKSLTAGTFQYAASVSVYDPSLSYLRKFTQVLSQISSRAMGAYDLISNSPPAELERKIDIVADGVGLYDSGRNERIVPLDSIAFNGQTLLESLTKDINSFVTLFTKMSPTNPLSVDGITNMLLSMVRKKDPYGIKEFSDIAENFKRGLEQILEAKMPKDPNLESTTAVQKLAANTTPTKINILTHKHYFSDLFEFGKRYGTGYLYLSEKVAGNISNPGGLPTFSRDFFNDRRSEEFNKYFGSYNQVGSPNSFASPDGTSYEQSSYQYFTPKAIKNFGKQTIVQTAARSQDENILSYDINKYADLFSDLVSNRIYSQDYKLPFFSAQDFDVTPRDLFNSANKSLYAHGCLVSEGTEQQFSIPSVGESISKVIKIGKQGNEKTEVDSPRLIGTFLGGNEDTDLETNDFLKSTERELTPYATGTYGAVIDPSSIDKDEIPFVPAGLPPTKLTFAILGELELDSKIDATSYLKETFNSMITNVNKLGLDDVSVQSAIENKYAAIPNQFKSMFVIAASQKAKSLGGAGFDAVRPQLEDTDVADFSDSISYINENEDFPPYLSTRDPMKTYAKFLAFWMNYKQIGVIEYLSGFNDLGNTPFGVRVGESDPTFSRKPLLPVWRKFTPDEYNSTNQQTLLCRVRNISKNDMVFSPETMSGSVSNLNKGIDVDFKEMFDLPIYNRYFILRGQ